jgi:predicted nucleic acid-binding protein
MSITEPKQKSGAMKIFFDVNVILDFFLERSPKQDLINTIFQKLDEGEINGYITLSVIQTCSYYLQQAKGTQVTKEIVGVLCKRFEILDGSKSNVLSAIESDLEDIEDAIHYFICISHEIQAMITNDLDFLKASKPHLLILTPEELIRKY